MSCEVTNMLSHCLTVIFGEFCLFQVLHYVEKPGTFISSTVSAGAYLFTPDIFDHLGKVFAANHQNELM